MPRDCRQSLDLKLIERALHAFKTFYGDLGPWRIPSHLYDEALKNNFDLKGFERSKPCRAKGKSFTATTIQKIRRQLSNIGQSIDLLEKRNSSQQQKPSGSNSMINGSSRLSTQGKRWSWSIEARQRISAARKGKKPKCISPGINRKYKDGDRALLKYFQWMQNRCIRNNRHCSFPRTSLGFKEFCDEMGAIPSGMLRPSVGRKNHDRGYVTGNIQWEEFKDNNWRNRKVEDQQRKAKEDSQNDIPF